MAEISDHLARRLAALQAEINAKGMGDPCQAKLEEIRAIVGQGIPDGAAAQWSAWYRLMEILDIDPFKNMPGPPHG